MMRFHCPHCRQILEVVDPTPTLLCPACEQWCRIPIPDEFELSRGDVREVAPPPPKNKPFEPSLAPSEPAPPVPPARSYHEPPPVVRPDAVTRHRPDELPLRLQDEAEEIEDVPMEIVRDGDAQPRKRRRRRRRRSSGIGIDIDYWISPSLILLFLLVPPALLLVIVSFFVHPGAGFGCLLMVGGGIWFTFIAAEDGIFTALLVMFVPFYSWYFAFINFERVAIPFVIQCVGSIIFTVSLTAAGMQAA